MLVRDLGSQNGTVLLRQGREFRLGEETIFLTDTLRFGEVSLLARDSLRGIVEFGWGTGGPTRRRAAGSSAKGVRRGSGGGALRLRSGQTARPALPSLR